MAVGHGCHVRRSKLRSLYLNMSKTLQKFNNQQRIEVFLFNTDDKN